MLPDVHDFPVLLQYITLKEKLLTEKNIEIIKAICYELIRLTPDATKEGKRFNELTMKERPGSLVYDFTTAEPYKRLAIIHEKEGNVPLAIAICHQALASGFDSDGTKSGFKGRIEKLEKKVI